MVRPHSLRLRAGVQAIVLIAGLLAASTLAGCAGTTAKQRRARLMAVTGLAGVTAGACLVPTCDAAHGDLCGTSEAARIGAGITLGVVGAVLMAVGLARGALPSNLRGLASVPGSGTRPPALRP